MKRNIRRVVVLLVLFSLGDLTTTSAQEWFKGALHIHSLWSDGNNFPEVIAEYYKERGYNFLTVTEHNAMQIGTGWASIKPGSSTKRNMFDHYLQRFGEDWVEYTRFPNDSIRVRLKALAEYRSHVEQPGKFLLVNGEEITSPFEKTVPVHVNAFNTTNVISKKTGKSRSEVMENAVNAVLEQGTLTGKTVFSFINHPNFYWALNAADIMNVNDVHFLEIFNAGSTGNYGDDEHENVEDMWDQINVRRVLDGRPLLYGVATDDMHGLNQADRAWVMVSATSLHADRLAEAMLLGDFYASTGVYLETVEANRKRLAIKVKKEENVNYKIVFLGVRRGEDRTTVFSEVEGEEASYILCDDDLFVRAKIISSRLHKNPFQKGDTEVAWTQPICH
ncbi:PHP domain-containing protein [Parapedobacter deserti]|uniref:PHP domain-containing protein n=1 Tax=Parapedobacter deserti TaxID=1912957 RepID=A0ABV7JNG2_9SPHI